MSIINSEGEEEYGDREGALDIPLFNYFSLLSQVPVQEPRFFQSTSKLLLKSVQLKRKQTKHRKGSFTYRNNFKQNLE